MGRSTAMYIDGYNLYYGRIRGTPYKWVDLVALFDSVVQKQDPHSQVHLVRYFSAFCLANFATHGRESTEAQNRYLRVHEMTYGSRFCKTMGTHTHDRHGVSMPRYVEGSRYDRRDRVKVWRLDEKQTDVNIALAMYRDARQGKFSQLVICSNDSDVEPVLRSIREDFPDVRIGVITPRPPPDPDSPSHRNVMSSLSRHADWTRSHIHDTELEAFQFPSRIHTGRRPIDKPHHW